MKLRLLMLASALVLAACAPRAVQIAEAPPGTVLSEVEPNTFVLVAERGYPRAVLRFEGTNLAAVEETEGRTNCAYRDDGYFSCRLAPFAGAYAVKLSGEVSDALAFLCDAYRCAPVELSLALDGSKFWPSK